MTLAALCASHTPLMRDASVPPETKRAVAESFRRLGRWVEAFAPELVIQFSPDHFNGFFYDLMPSFCLGLAAESLGDWGTRTGPLAVPAELALKLAEEVQAADVDVALSYRMGVDHGFVQIWEAMLERIDAYPLVPIFVNCAAPPLPSLRRTRLLGEAVGRFAQRSGKRVLFVASGGLSHDPPIPDIRMAPPDRREFLIAGRNPSTEARRQREERVRAAGLASARGEGPCLPLNPAWDHAFLDLLCGGELSRADVMTDAEISAQGGRGGHEIRAWVAALAALGAAGPYRANVEFYEAIPAWIAGMAMLTARSKES